MQFQICLVGLNHRTAPIEIRERFSLNGISARDLNLIEDSGPIREVMILSTCNRVEILIVGDKEKNLKEFIIKKWANFCEREPRELMQYVYTYIDSDAISHLFSVASGLDSMVVGEPQILGQIKDAYREALENNTAHMVLNRLLERTFSVAKRIRTETKISQSAVSVSYAAVELAKEIFPDLKSSKALLIGAGEMAELAAIHLLNAGVKEFFITNRTYERAVELANKFKVNVISFTSLLDFLTSVDILITSTGSEQPIIKIDDVKRVMKKRKYRPIFIIDIAVPRDVDPDVNNLDNVYLYDIDDLQGVVEENLALRKEEAKIAKNIIKQEVKAFNKWWMRLELSPTIKELLEWSETIARKELNKSLKKIKDKASQEIKKEMELLAVNISKKICYAPILFMKSKVTNENDKEQYVSLIREIFSLDKNED